MKVNSKNWKTLFGFQLVILGLLCSEELLAYVFSPDARIENELYKLIILSARIILVAGGLVVLLRRNKPRVLMANAALTVFLISIPVLFLTESALHIWLYASPSFQLIGEMYSRVDTHEKVVALTFDDGPREPYTMELLDVLDQYGVKATFFLLGRRIEEYPDVARQLLARGHQIGNHTYDHPKMIYRSPSFVRSQIERTNTLLREVVGVQGEIVFRSPHGEKFIVLPIVLSQMGIKNILFDINPEDYNNRTADEVFNFCLTHVGPGSIILLHDGNSQSGKKVSEVVARIIPALRLRGYRFKTVSELLTYDQSK